MNVYCFDIHGFKPSPKLTIKFVFHYHAMTSQFSNFTISKANYLHKCYKAGYELNE